MRVSKKVIRAVQDYKKSRERIELLLTSGTRVVGTVYDSDSTAAVLHSGMVVAMQHVAAVGPTDKP